MRQNPRLFRLSATVAIGALLGNTILPVAAPAQPAPPPPVSSPAQPDQSQGDPPDRVGRIARQTGPVSFRTSADTQWSAATPNYPVSAGNAFWTEPAAFAELEISASRVALAGQTEFDVTTLNDSGMQAVAPQGEAYFRLRDLAPDEVWSVQTPRGMVRLTEAGRYDIVLGTTEQPTLITVLEGSAELEGPGLSLKLAANQTATVTGSDPYQGSVGPAVRGAFLISRLRAERSPSPRAASLPADLTDLPGIVDLADVGEWSPTPDYGDVWYPPVSPAWVPYRDGEWAYVAPWGWTWVDAAPWGFAPFHYGRWAHIDGRWGWVPGDMRAAQRPVYAPALVTFLGLSAGAVAGAALARGSVAWVPLGPREAYHPWYQASPNYVRQINAAHISNGATTASGPIDGLVNRGAATSVPAGIMTGSRPVRLSARPVPDPVLATLHPVIGQPPIRPTTATLGVTPAVARQLDLVQGGRDAQIRRAAPGPVVPVQQTGQTGGVPVRPVLIGPRREQPDIPRQGETVVPRRESVPPPDSALPLPTPGTRPPGLPAPTETRPPDERFRPGPPGPRPEGIFRPEPGPNPEPGVPRRLPEPVARPEGVPEPHEIRRPAEPPIPPAPPGVRPAGTFRPPGVPEPEHRMPTVERPIPEPRPVPPAPEIRRELPPREMAPEPPHREPPHVDQVRPQPPRVEAPRPAPSGPRAGPDQRRPGER